jgi:hypothetical protein
MATAHACAAAVRRHKTGEDHAGITLVARAACAMARARPHRLRPCAAGRRARPPARGHPARPPRRRRRRRAPAGRPRAGSAACAGWPRRRPPGRRAAAPPPAAARAAPAPPRSTAAPAAQAAVSMHDAPAHTQRVSPTLSLSLLLCARLRTLGLGRPLQRPPACLAAQRTRVRGAAGRGGGAGSGAAPRSGGPPHLERGALRDAQRVHPEKQELQVRAAGQQRRERGRDRRERRWRQAARHGVHLRAAGPRSSAPGPRADAAGSSCALQAARTEGVLSFDYATDFGRGDEGRQK